MSRAQEPTAPRLGQCSSLLSQGDGHFERGALVLAEDFLRRGLSCQEREMPLDHPEIATSYDKLAELTRLRGSFAEAESLLRKAVTIWSGTGSHSADLATAYNRLAHVYYDQRRYYEAEPLARKSKQLAEAACGAGSEDVAIALNTLGMLHAALKDSEGAEREFRRALALQNDAGRRNVHTAGLLHNLASVRFNQGFAREAEQLYGESLELLEQLVGPDSPELRITLEAYAKSVKRNGRKPKLAC